MIVPDLVTLLASVVSPGGITDENARQENITDVGGHDLVALLDICLFLDMVKSQPSILVKRQVAGYITGIAGPQGHAADVAVSHR